MHADARKLRWDARRAAERVTRFIEIKNFDEVETDDLLRSAIERQLTILGEALSQRRQFDPATAAVLPALARIVGFRNVLVHGYASVDNRIVWGVIETHLAPLLAALKNLLAQPQPGLTK